MFPSTNNPYTLLLVSLGLSIVPVLLMGCTSYLKLNIVFGLIKNALGTQNAPGALITALLSVVLTAYIMQPTGQAMQQRYNAVYLQSDQLLSNTAEQEKLGEIMAPYAAFIQKHIDEKSKALFVDLRPKLIDTAENSSIHEDDDSLFVLIPAFVVSELKDSFRIGILLLLPFLLVDLIICNLLAGLGMHMVNPLTIGLPIKLFLFFSADCWSLLVKALILSYR